MFDILICGGEVLDGSGAAAFRADIGVRGDRVTAVGDLRDAHAALRLDAVGLTVAPGFVDIHTHSDFTLLVDGRADSQICQGVTTEVIGQCGFSAAPMGEPPEVGHLIGYVDAGVPLTWRSFGEYLERLQQARPAVNVAAFVGHGAIRRAAADGALATMRALAEQSFDEGAIGLSTGLEYWPGNEAPAGEIEALVGVAARRGALYATHVRNRDVDYEMGFAEAIRSARRTGARLQISHIQPKFGAPAGAMAHTLQMIHDARRDGVDVAFDVIPHDWSHTVVVSALPAWAREGGTQGTLQRLRDPAQRERMKDNPRPIWRLVTQKRWERIVLLHSVAHPELVGLDFAAIGQLRRADPHDAVFDLLVDEGEGLAQMMWTSRNFEDDDICTCLREPLCSVMSDTLAVSSSGPLKGTIGSLSGYGWTARVLGHYTRERGVLTLPQAVHRLTGRPAERLGLVDRGALRPGAFADIVVFDPARVQDRSSITAPARHPSGYVHVMVNGRPVLVDGVRNEEQPGRVLRAGH
jgi:N-acyl-D-amino-acid deacylase